MCEYSKMIYEKVRAFLDTDEWRYTFREEGIFEMMLKMDSSISILRILIIVENDCFQVRAVLPVGVDVNDDKKLFELLKFITTVNYQSRIGNFMVDLNDGEIAYKVHVDCEGIEDIGDIIVKNSVSCAAIMFKRHMVGIEGILFLGSDAKSAVEKCELVEKKRLMSLLATLDGESPTSD